MQVIPVTTLYAGHPAAGDVLVLSAYDIVDQPPPAAWTLVAQERGPANALDASASQPVLEAVYRFDG